MRILVLQLARLGDLFLTWPSMRALRRTHPEAEIWLVTRRRFRAAAEGLSVMDRIHELPTDDILAPLLQEQPDVPSALAGLEGFLGPLTEKPWDKIINLSFSNASADIAHVIGRGGGRVTGYTRHDDGTLNFGDDVSAYFYAQAGIERDSRVHVADLFAGVCGIEILEEDWATPFSPNPGLPEPYLCVHLGASTEDKRYPARKLGEAVARLRSEWPGYFLLLGSQEERGLVDEFLEAAGSERVISGVGQTTIQSLFTFIGNAKMLIGADSAPMHVASLTGTPALNLSFSSVNFWETAPRAASSRIVKAASPAELNSVVVAGEALRMLNGEEPLGAVAESQSRSKPIQSLIRDPDDFRWRLVEGIYITKNPPAPESPLFISGLQRLQDVTDLVFEQLKAFETTRDSATLASILDRADEIVQAIGGLIPDTAPLVRWLQAQKVRIPPSSFEDVLRSTTSVYGEFKEILGYYLKDCDGPQSGDSYGRENHTEG